ncbi:MAG TPA: glycosyltransferase family 87 protein [Candidatus Nanopelagicales bacterium]|nr:glycosyltransferase family 87 protein [Candidatus Nanopelagicales bacterium]
MGAPGGAEERWALFRPTRERALAGAWLAAVWVASMAVDAARTRPLGHDAHAYWLATLDPSVYGRLPGEPDAFLYSPPVAQVLAAITWIPWPLFVAVWTSAAITAYVWLVRPLRWIWAVPLLALAIEDTTLGNVTWLTALLVVVGMRRSIAWVPLAFTKVTAGVGLLWYVVRRDWRAVGVALGTGVAVLVVSFLASPGLWRAYATFMVGLGGSGVLLRTVAASALVVFAARTDRPWLVPVAVVVCAPLALAYTWAALLAVPRLLRPETLTALNAPFGGIRVGLRRALDLQPRDQSVGTAMVSAPSGEAS